MRSLIVAVAVALGMSAIGAAQAPLLQRGDTVHVRAAAHVSPATAALPMVVVAAPGDRVSLVNGSLRVNDVAMTQFSPHFIQTLTAAADRLPTLIQPGHYFVMGEQRVNQNISEYWGLHSGTSLELAR